MLPAGAATFGGLSQSTGCDSAPVRIIRVTPRLLYSYAMIEPGLRYQAESVSIGLRSRFLVRLLRWTLKPMMRWYVRGSRARIARGQLQLAGRRCRDTAGLEQDYRIVGGVPGSTLGEIDNTEKPVLLWLHGGGFLIPASPAEHLGMLGLLCREVDAAGFLPDYRLAPFNRFPAALDDAENAYRGLLEAGFAPERILIGGESAGGHLALGLLQRIRKAGLAMPACAALHSPVTEMGRVHAPPSRALEARRDAIVPISSFHRMTTLFTGDRDTSDAELSPLYADYLGFPPLLFLVGENETLRDDSVLAAAQARRAGVPTELRVWPVLPHGFLLFERLLPEAAKAREVLAAFFRDRLGAAAVRSDSTVA